MRSRQEATTLCASCPKLCRHACPVADAEKTEQSTPWGKMSAMKKVDEHKLPMDHDTMGLAYKCLTCRGAEQACELDNPVTDSLGAYRIRAFHAGLTPGGVEAYCEKFRKYSNPYGKDLLRGLKMKFPREIKKSRAAASRGKRTAYFPGCTEIEKSPTTIGKSLSLLDGVTLYDEPIQCCGYPLFAAGDWKEFVELAELNTQALKSYDRIITGAPACLYTMQTLYPSTGHKVDTQFEHIVDVLDALRKERGLEIRKDEKKTVAYHDPCYLGRYRGTYDEPRKLIRRKTGKAPIEFIRNREHSACSGAGGLLPVSFPTTAAKVTESRVEEFRRTGADVLVTSCPTCVHRFRKFGVPAQGLVEFLADRKQKNK